MSKNNKPRSISPDEVPGEFSKRVLLLMASFYDTSSTRDITPFPPLQPTESSSQQTPQKLDFESAITDLRVRRALESQAASSASITDSIEQRVEGIEEEFEQNTVDLNDVFNPEPLPRPEIPKYLVNQQLDEQFEIQLRKTRKLPPINSKDIEKTQTARLKTSKKRGIERAKRRVEKQTTQTSTPKKNYYKRKEAEHEEENTLRSVLKQKDKRNNEIRASRHVKPDPIRKQTPKQKTPQAPKYYDTE